MDKAVDRFGDTYAANEAASPVLELTLTEPQLAGTPLEGRIVRADVSFGYSEDWPMLGVSTLRRNSRGGFDEKIVHFLERTDFDKQTGEISRHVSAKRMAAEITDNGPATAQFPAITQEEPQLTQEWAEQYGEEHLKPFWELENFYATGEDVNPDASREDVDEANQILDALLGVYPELGSGNSSQSQG